MTSQYRKQLYVFLAIVALIKLVIAGSVELGNDEVYYYTYALQPDWNHFDHPPMVGLLIQLTTFNLHWLSDVAIRLGAITGCVLSSIFVFNTVAMMHNERTAWYAALLFNCSVYTGVIAGLFILPDSPQIPFWTASLYIMCRMIIRNEVNKTGSWVLLGLLIGLAALSKVHGLYLWAGFGFFILLKRIKWLLNWRLYVAVMITLLCLIPIVYWNIQNDFITYKFHSERVTHHQVMWDSLLREILGEFAYQNPIVFVLVVASLIALLRKQKIFSSALTVWSLCMSLPMIALFWGVALFNDTLPHWSGPAYIPLFFVTAQYLDVRAQKKYPTVVKWAGGLVLFVLIAGSLLSNYAPRNFGSQDKENYGEYCPTLDLNGWDAFGKKFAQIEREDIAAGRMKADAPIVVNKWFPGAHIEKYVATKTHQRVLGVGLLDDLHKFAWLNKERKPLQLHDDAYCITASNLPFDPVKEYAAYFETIEKPVVINQYRSGKVVRYFYVYRMKDCKLLPPPLLK